MMVAADEGKAGIRDEDDSSPEQGPLVLTSQEQRADGRAKQASDGRAPRGVGGSA